jgi:hypothetical protein
VSFKSCQNILIYIQYCTNMCKMSCSVCKIYRGFPSADYSTYASDVTKQTALLYASSCSFMFLHVAEVWCAKVQTRFSIHQE